MKVLFCLCACIAVSSAGIFGYPVASFNYAYPSAIAHPFATFSSIARPYGIAYGGVHGYPLAVAPSYFSYNLLPGNVVFSAGPEFVHYIPLAPPNGKGKPGKKKPGDKKNENGTKEETTEEPKTEEESETKPAEDLSE